MEFSLVGIISTAFAVVSIICFCISNFRKTKKEIVFLHMCSNICDLAMYFVLGAKTGMANAFANICKNAAYSKFDSNSFTVIFAILRIVLLVIGYECITTIMFIILEVFSTVFLIQGTAQ